MLENTYRIYYKNGNTLDCKAYDMELKDGVLYQSLRPRYGDMPKLSAIDGSKMDHIECIRKAHENEV